MESFAARHENKRAEQALEDAIAAVQHCIGSDDKSADAHSLLADLYGRKISLGGCLAGPRFGPKIDAENKKALELAPGNVRVYASLGRQYLYAPKMFGGNIDKAIENFRDGHPARLRLRREFRLACHRLSQEWRRPKFRESVAPGCAAQSA